MRQRLAELINEIDKQADHALALAAGRDTLAASDVVALISLGCDLKMRVLELTLALEQYV